MAALSLDGPGLERVGTCRLRPRASLLRYECGPVRLEELRHLRCADGNRVCMVSRDDRLVRGVVAVSTVDRPGLRIALSRTVLAYGRVHTDERAVSGEIAKECPILEVAELLVEPDAMLADDVQANQRGGERDVRLAEDASSVERLGLPAFPFVGQETIGSGTAAGAKPAAVGNRRLRIGAERVGEQPGVARIQDIALGQERAELRSGDGQSCVERPCGGVRRLDDHNRRCLDETFEVSPQLLDSGVMGLIRRVQDDEDTHGVVTLSRDRVEGVSQERDRSRHRPDDGSNLALVEAAGITSEPGHSSDGHC